jgi:Tc5 transposase DNA-binding domain/CENP-B N-terminal DNA-binding domain
MIGTEDQAKQKIRKANNVLQLNQRLELLQKVEEGKKSYADLAREFNVDPAVITRLKKNAQQLKGRLAKASGNILQRKRLRQGKYLDVDEKVFAWIKYMREKFSATKLPVNKTMIQLQAIKYAKEMNIQNFNASAGWLDRFKSRYGLKNVNLHVEMGDVDIAAIDEEMRALRQKIAAYDLECIFNMDETGLFFRCLPKRSYILGNEKESEVRGSKKMVYKNRVTLVVCCNGTNSMKIPVYKRKFCFCKIVEFV